MLGFCYRRVGSSEVLLGKTNLTPCRTFLNKKYAFLLNGFFARWRLYVPATSIPGPLVQMLFP